MTALGYSIKYVLPGSAFAPHSNPIVFKVPKEANVLRRTTIAFSNGMAAALLIIGLGRVVVFVKSDDAIWWTVAISAGAAAVLSFCIAERSRTKDSLLAFR